MQGLGQKLGPARILPTAAVPEIPGNLAAVRSGAAIHLTWDGVPKAAYYRVSRADTTGGTYVLLGTASWPAYQDATGEAGHTYFYVVTGVNFSGESDISDEASATLIPAAPANLVATGTETDIGLAWDASTGATSYKVYRSLAEGGPYTLLKTAGTNAATDDTAAADTVYYYVVTALNAAGESGNSGEAFGERTAPAPPSLPVPDGFYYKFANGALLTDSSGNGLDLTNVNSVTQADGVVGKAALFTPNPVGTVTGESVGFVSDSTDAKGTVANPTLVRLVTVVLSMAGDTLYETAPGVLQGMVYTGAYDSATGVITIYGLTSNDTGATDYTWGGGNPGQVLILPASDNVNLPLGTNGTIFAWYKMSTDPDGNRMLFQLNDNNTSQTCFAVWQVGVSNPANMRIQIPGVYKDAAYGTVNNWHFLCIRKTGNTVEARINGGAFFAVNDGPGTPEAVDPGPYNLRIGGYSEAPSVQWLGGIDILAKYNSSLSNAQVDLAYNSGAGREP